MSRFKFNLISEPWLTYVDLNGAQRGGGLIDLLAGAHEIRDLLSPAPVVKASLYRLLLAILGRVFGLQDEDGWVALRQAGSFNRGALEAYFSRFEERFDLFHPDRPFYGAADERVKPKKLLKMVPHLASGNNATLFDHSTEAEGVTLTPAEAALYLVALQYHGLGGLSGIPDKFTAAPAGKGISYFVQGSSLFETLLLNLMPPVEPALHAIPCPDPARDLPCWEMTDPFEPRTTPYGWFDYLTWQNRRVLLFPELEQGQVVVRRMTEAPGLRLDEQFIDGLHTRDPFQAYRLGAQGPLPLRFSEERAVWRDSATLFRFNGGADELPAPANLEWLRLLAMQGLLDTGSRFRIQALGMASDKAKMLFYGEEYLPLPAVYLEDRDSAVTLQRALNLAEELSKGLYAAVMRMSELLIDFDSDLTDQKPDPKMTQSLFNHLRPDRVYWAGLETPFYQLVEEIPAQPEIALVNWEEALRSQTWAALEYSISLSGDGMVAQKAAVKARSIAGARIKAHLKPKEVVRV